MFAPSAVKHTSLGVAVITRRSQHHLRDRQTSFKKRTFVGRQKCVFCWRRRRDCLAARVRRCTVATKAFALPHPTELGRQKPSCCHSLALPSSRTASGRARPSRASGAIVKSLPPTKKGHRLVSFFRWRRRRDLNSRAAYNATYTLSRGASSAS